VNEEALAYKGLWRLKKKERKKKKEKGKNNT
jgi:hypothetical protein